MTKIKKYMIILTIIFVIVLVISTTLFYLFYTPHKNIIKAEAENQKIDYKLVLAVIKVESNYCVNSVSKKGAIGLMQLMPETAKWIYEKQLKLGKFNLDFLYNPDINIKLGVWYLGYLLEKFEVTFALAAYNAGEGVVKEWLKNDVDKDGIPYPETKKYVEKVLFYRKIYNWK